MIELLLSVCLYAEISKCKDVPLVNTEEHVTAMHCMMQAPAALSTWLDTHPKYFVKEWKCRKAGQEANL